MLAKYGNGDVAWYAGRASITIPGTSAGLLGGNYGPSHYTLFDAVPEPTTMIAGALLLPPFGSEHSSDAAPEAGRVIAKPNTILPFGASE
ncbi:MAG: hypothetical protein WCQ21_18930 [Verrucomicrobiota bacterium]